MTPNDIDATPAVELDWLLAIDGTVAKVRNEQQGG